MTQRSDKVVIYATHGPRVLAFSHVDHPEIGLQVPAGTVESGESPTEAARREFSEETGLTVGGTLRYVGKCDHWMMPFRDEMQHRHFFHAELTEVPAERWLHVEQPTSRDQKAERFAIEWLPLVEQTRRALSVGQGRFLNAIPGFGEPKHAVAPRRLEARTVNESLAAYRRRRVSLQLEAMASAFPDKQAALELRELSERQRVVLEHAFLWAIQGAEQDDAACLVTARGLIDYLSDESAGVVVVDSRLCREAALGSYESPAFLLTTCAVDKASSDLVFDEALRSIERYGMCETTDGAFGAAIVLSHRGLLDATNSYTLSGVPGTVFLDYVPNAFRLGEIILHEATHNWLNDALESAGVRLPTQPEFWSPWRHRPRPASGILHATLVFSRLLQYFARGLALGDLSEYEAAYASQRLSAEAAVLREHISTLRQVLDSVPAVNIRDLCREELNRALNLEPRTVGGNR